MRWIPRLIEISGRIFHKMTNRMLYPKIILPVFEAFNFLTDFTQISKAQILRRF
jgi:hypothetical protein